MKDSPYGELFQILIGAVLGILFSYFVNLLANQGLSLQTMSFFVFVFFALLVFKWIYDSERRLKNIPGLTRDVLVRVYRQHSNAKLVTDNVQIYDVEDKRLFDAAKQVIRVLGTGFTQEDMEVVKTAEPYVSLIKQTKGISFRRIQIMDMVQLKWLDRVAEILEAQEDNPNFEVRLNYSLSRQTPNLVICDEQEVEISVVDDYYRRPSLRRGPKTTATRAALYVWEPSFVVTIKDYFDALWESPDCEPVSTSRLRQIRDRLETERRARVLDYLDTRSDTDDFDRAPNIDHIGRALQIPDRFLLREMWQEWIAS